MHSAILRDLVVVFAVAVAVVLLLRRIGVPSIAGFIAAGALIGPQALGWVHSIEQVELMAEVGVVLLLFSIGLELSLDRLKRLWRAIALGGLLQVSLTLASTLGIARLFALPMPTALFLGYVVSVSSTAIVLRGLEARGESDAPHGRLTLGILVFQDLGVVPMMISLPYLVHPERAMQMGSDVFLSLGRSIAFLVLVLAAARYGVPRLLHLVASSRQRDIFVLFVILLCFGTAWVASQAGISLELGAFLAGMIVAGSDYRHQALSDVIPFREVLTSLFFVSVGMLLEPQAILGNAGLTFGILAAVLLGKFFVMLVVGGLMRLPLRVTLLAAAALCQIGEFSFVLIKEVRGSTVLPEPLAASILAAAILSMIVTPLMLMIAPHLAAGVGKHAWLRKWASGRSVEEARASLPPSQGHVIIAGFGLGGRELAKALKDASLPYLIVELNAETVRKAALEGEPMYYGDISSREVLESLGVHQATELILLINDPSALERVVRAVRQVRSDLTITVRARYVADVDKLYRAGATRVIAAELEAAAAVIAEVLERHGVGADAFRERAGFLRKALSRSAQMA